MIGGAYEPDTGILHLVYQRSGAFCVNALDGNAAKAHAGNLQAGFAKYTIFHSCYLQIILFSTSILYSSAKYKMVLGQMI